MNTIRDHKIPEYVTDQNTLKMLIENMKTMDIEQRQNKPQNMICILKLVMSLLLLVQEESNKHLNSIKFIYEQLHLMNMLDYSTEMIFSSLLSNCLLKGYRLLRDSKNIILPNYSTIKWLTLSTYINPLIELYDKYIKNKFKLLEQKDTRVFLLVDEIHLKPNFDYRGGNIIGLSDNSNEAATSGFAFMLNSVFTQYKDVHVMPTKCLKAENLFDKVKHIDLEGVGFQVLSIITDNNAINKKAISFFYSPSKVSIVYSCPVRNYNTYFVSMILLLNLIIISRYVKKNIGNFN